jgi:LacI family transcriptional regulator
MMRAGLVCRAILCDSDDPRQKETRYHELLEEDRGRGVLLTPVAVADARIGRLQGRGNPVVLVDSRSRLRVQCTGSVG